MVGPDFETLKNSVTIETNFCFFTGRHMLRQLAQWLAFDYFP
jgi:hypothetical protein